MKGAIAWPIVLRDDAVAREALADRLSARPAGHLSGYSSANVIALLRRG